MCHQVNMSPKLRLKVDFEVSFRRDQLTIRKLVLFILFIFLFFKEKKECWFFFLMLINKCAGCMMEVFILAREKNSCISGN